MRPSPAPERRHTRANVSLSKHIIRPRARAVNVFSCSLAPLPAYAPALKTQQKTRLAPRFRSPDAAQMNGTAAKSASAVSVPPVPPVNICSMALAKASPMACTNASITGGAVPPATAGIAIIKTIRSAINTSDTSVNIDEMTMPAMATPLYLSPVSLERLNPRQLRISPRIGNRNAKTSPATAQPFVCSI